MSELNRNLLGKKAKELGFIRDTYEKVCRLTNILKFIGNDDLLCDELALKGGTSINFTLFNLPRLSVDIDLDFTIHVDRETMLEHRLRITERISKYMVANGYGLSKKSKNFHALDSFVYEYQNSAGIKDNLKIEINYMNRSHVLQTMKVRHISTWDSSEFTIHSLDPIEIFAGKITALFNRSAARDLYDVHNLVKENRLSLSELITLRKCIVFYSAIGSESPPTAFDCDKVGSISERKIKTDLYPVLRSKEKFDLIEAQRLVRSWLQDLLRLDENEENFLMEFRNGNYNPELLFTTQDILERIENHPMALWKCSRK